MKTNVLSRYGQLFVILGVMCSRCRGAIGQSSSCGKGWIKYKDHCYLLVQSNVTWTEARSKCLHESSELTSIHSLEENKFLSSRLPNNSEFWIGLESWKLRKDNHWTDKSSLNFLGFSVRSEDVLKFSTGFCVYIEQKSGYWKTSDCRFISISGYICKRPAYNGPANTQSQFQVACTKERPSSCYTLYTESRPWEEAQRLCREQNQNLVTITDRQTLLYLKSIVELNVISIWTGISLHNGSFKWDTGDIQDPYSWVSTDKEAVSGCVALQSFVWKAHNCNNSLPFLCENRQDTAMNKHDIAMNKQDTAMNKQDTAMKKQDTAMKKQDTAMKKQDTAMKKQDTAMNWLDTSMNRQNTATNRPDTSINRQDTSMNWPDTSIDDTMSRMSLATLTRFVVSPRLVPGLHSQTISRPKQILDETDNDKFVVGKSRPKSLVIREAANDVQCPYGWIQNMDKCYKVMKKGEDWHGARKYCENLGANLPSIHSSLENGFLTSIAIRYGVYEIWIGLHDSSQETVFEWTDGTSYNFQRWLAGEPNNYRASEDCVELYHGNWNDDNCNYVRPYVCVKKLVPITAVTNSSAGPATRPGVTTLLAITTTVHVVSKSSIPATISEVSKSSLPATTSEVSKTSLPATTSEVSKTSLPATTSEVSKSSLPATTSEVSKTSLPATTSEVSKTSLPATTSEVSKTSLPATTSEVSKSSLPATTSEVSKSLLPATTSEVSKTSLPATTSEVSKTSLPATTSEVSKTSLPATTSEVSKTSLPATTSEVSKSSLPATTSEVSKSLLPATTSEVSKTSLPATTSEVSKSSLPATTSDVSKSSLPTTTSKASKSAILTKTSGVSKSTSIPTTALRIPKSTSIPTTALRIPKSTSIPTTALRIPKSTSIPTTSSGASKSSSSPAKCPEKFQKFHTSCYLVVSQLETWDEARSSCQACGADLAKTEHVLQLSKMTLLLADYGVIKPAWIGIKQMDGSRIEWTDRTPVRRFFWANNKTSIDSANRSTPFCVSLSDSKWRRTDCREKRAYICQIKLVRPTAKVPLLNNETLCKDGKSVQHGDYCYLMTKHQVSWPEADHVCKHRGMQLVSIHSNSQTNFLVNYTQHTSETLYYWIGLVSYRNGSFHWSDGSSITYDNWAEDPREDSEEKCAVLDSNKGRWYPTNCRTESHGYICSSHSRDVKILPSSEPVRPYISGGVRAAIVVAALSACGLLVFAVVFLLRRRRRRQPSDEELLNSTAFENALYVSSRTEDEQTTFTANV
ncbi:lymphocyte antigen 75 [Biomphalaria pfeifferi]|uniref:Lymphocyte antigen 75 n=1 Tax=Biomphalaria pfeifferi TaxID=112525 RepID=A0AAD8C8B5_BIOPF|nr:lymphocyte antigen 75 [Biomphalaria pfeifferi]